MSYFCAPSFVRPVVSAPRRLCALSLSLLFSLMLLACLLCAPAAHAGGYSVSYSSTSGSPGGPPGGGGSGGITAGGKLQPYLYASGQYDPGSGGYYDYGASTSSYPATAGGQITATFTWVGNSPSDPPPPAVIITQSCSASGPGGAADNGLGSPTTNSGQQCVGVNFSANNSPGQSFTVTCSPSASSTKGIISVGYKAEVAPVTLTLTGPTPSQAVNRPGDSSGSYSILVGQGCGANLSGIPSALLNNATNPPTYQWSVSGTTFQDWEPTTPQVGTTPVNTQASYFLGGSGPLTNPTAHWYWNDPSNKNETVSCTATVTPPSGQGSQFGVTATQNVSVMVPPFSCNQHQGYVTTGTDAKSGATILVAASNTSKYPYGETWIGQVQTPALFGSGGYWYYCQLITPGRSHTYGSSTVSCTQNGIQGLDLRTPYMADPTDPFPNGASGWPADNTQHHDGDSPLTGVADAKLGTADSIHIHEQFLTSLMYVPPGNDVKPVPLFLLGWLWDASPSQPANGWLSATGNTLGSVATTPVSGTNVFPSWLLIESVSVGSGW